MHVAQHDAANQLIAMHCHIAGVYNSSVSTDFNSTNNYILHETVI